MFKTCWNCKRQINLTDNSGHSLDCLRHQNLKFERKPLNTHIRQLPTISQLAAIW